MWAYTEFENSELRIQVIRPSVVQEGAQKNEVQVVKEVIWSSMKIFSGHKKWNAQVLRLLKSDLDALLTAIQLLNSLQL